MITLLLMPFVLIAILGSALSAINDGGTPDIDIQLAVVNKDQPDAAKVKMKESIIKSGLPRETQAQMTAAMEDFNPTNTLLHNVLESKELNKTIHIKYLDSIPASEKEKLKYSAIAIIPENFSLQFYQHVFSKIGAAPEIKLEENESKSLESKVVKDIFTSFEEQVTLYSTLISAHIQPAQLQEKTAKQIGKIETVAKKEPINTVSYYAIGMSVMFIFYVASTIASLAYEQKESQVYNRILLANVPKLSIFVGIFLSTFIVVFLQINILFGMSALIFHVHWSNVIGYIVVTILLSMMIGGFAVLLSAISYRGKSEKTSQIFGSFLVPILAFLGGSFFPVSQFGEGFEFFSSFTPGGAGISAFMKMMQGYSLADISTQMSSIMVTVLLLVAVALLIQPNRGDSA
ncbi:ABC transporter permease [Cytobacillus sp. Hz8]|uniref:ABC transporter permease n=1 Tax=Cytobacillus sp. Hz8 TaxID=3347168 RepID=UPI0035DDA2F5